MAGPGGIEAGRAAVVVLPDVSKFARSLLKYLERVERTTRFEVPVTADTSGLGDDVRRAREQAEARPATLPVKAAADEFLRDARAAALKAAGSVQADIPLSAKGEALRRDLDRQVRALERMTSLRVPLDLDAAARFRADVVAQLAEVERLAASVRPTVRIRTEVDSSQAALLARMSSQVGELATGAASVARIVLLWGPPIIAAAAGLVAMAPAVAILLPLVAGFGAGIGVVVASVGELKTQFAPVGAAIKALQAPIASAFTDGLGPIAQSLATGLIPQLRQGLVGVAQVMNTAVAGVLRFAASAQGVRLITGLFEGLRPALTPLAAALAPLTRALLQIGVAALPGLRAFSEGLAGVITKFADFVAAGAKSGSLTDGISRAVSGTGALLAGLGNFLGPLAKGLAAIGPSVLSGLGAAFTALGGAITGIIAKARELGPAFSSAGVSLRPLGAVFSAVGAAIRAQVGFVVAAAQQLAPSLQPVVQVLGAVAAAIASGIGPAFATLRAALTPVIAGFQSFLNVVGPQLMPTFQALQAALAPIGATLASFARQVGGVLGPGLAQVGQVIASDLLPAFRAILPVVSPVANFLIKVIGSAVVGALKGAINVIKGLLRVISGIFNTFAGIFRGDWSRAWKGIQQIFSGAFTAIKGAIQVFINIGVLRLFRLGIQGALALWRGFGPALSSLGSSALSALRGVVTAGFNLVIAIAKAAPGKILAGLRVLGSGLKSLAVAAWNLFRSAVVTGTTTIVSYVKTIPGLIKSGLGNVGSLLVQAGRDLVQGMINGLKGAAGALASAAADMASSAVNAVKSKLRIGSPSKVMHQIGRWTAQGLARGIDTDSRRAVDAVKEIAAGLSGAYARGLRGSAGDVKQAAKDLLGQVKIAFGDRVGDPSGLKRLVLTEATGLRSLAVARERGAKRLEAARDRLDAAVKLRADYARQVADAARAFGSIIAAAPEDGVLSAGDVTAQLRQKLAAIALFRRNIESLKSQGLSDAALKQLVDAGVEAGGATAEALAYGGQAAINEVNQLTAAIGSQADSLGSSTAKQFYQAGVDAAQGLVEGLAAQQEAMDEAANKLADRLVKRVKKRLGINSPSTVMAGIGGFMGAGLVEGLESSRGMVQAATDRLTRVARPDVRAFGSVGAASPLASGVTVNVSNPVPETASETTTRVMRRLAVLGVA